VRIFTAGISHVVRRIIALLDTWNHLATNGTIWIIPLNEVEIMRSDGESQFGTRQEDTGALLGVEQEVLLQGCQ
jgi:hypothetical protein